MTQIFCCHGGIPEPSMCPNLSAINCIPVQLPLPFEQSQLAWNLMWNDPVRVSFQFLSTTVLENIRDNTFPPCVSDVRHFRFIEGWNSVSKWICIQQSTRNGSMLYIGSFQCVFSETWIVSYHSGSWISSHRRVCKCFFFRFSIMIDVSSLLRLVFLCSYYY